MLIVDCFTFYNELDLLKYRLNILNNVIDYFIIVESKYTHVGKEKELFFLKNKDLFKEFEHKIIHLIIETMPYIYPEIDIQKNQQWINEKYQRDFIKNGIESLKLSDRDLIIISDLDEIADPKTLDTIRVNDLSLDIRSMEMRFHYYNLITVCDSPWKSAKILSFKKYNELSLSCSDIRALECPILQNGGWHLSYFGDTVFIKNKIQNFAHQEFNNESYTNLEIIESRIKKSEDVYGRWYSKFNSIPIEQNTYLPPEYMKYLSNFCGV